MARGEHSSRSSALHAAARRLSMAPPALLGVLAMDMELMLIRAHELTGAAGSRILHMMHDWTLQEPQAGAFIAALAASGPRASMGPRWRVSDSELLKHPDDLQEVLRQRGLRPDIAHHLLKSWSTLPLAPAIRPLHRTVDIRVTHAGQIDLALRAHELDGLHEGEYWRRWRSLPAGQIDSAPQDLPVVASWDALLRLWKAQMDRPWAWTRSPPIETTGSAAGVHIPDLLQTTLIAQAAPGQYELLRNAMTSAFTPVAMQPVAMQVIRNEASGACGVVARLTDPQGQPVQAALLMHHTDSRALTKFMKQPKSHPADDILVAPGLEYPPRAGIARIERSGDTQSTRSTALHALISQLPACQHSSAQWQRDILKLSRGQRIATSGVRLACPECYSERLMRLPGITLNPEALALHGITQADVQAEEQHNRVLDERAATDIPSRLLGIRDLQQLHHDLMQRAARPQRVRPRRMQI